MSGDFADEFVHHLKPDLLVHFLAALEPQFDSHLMALAKEPDGVVDLYRQVTRVTFKLCSEDRGS